MAEAAPKFARTEVVYIRESAALGFLEAYKIQSIHYTPDGLIHYQICQSFTGPDVNTTFGDRIRHRSLPNITFLEQDLITYCEALVLVDNSLTAQINTIRSLQPGSGCDE
jgi:hypothetical protein